MTRMHHPFRTAAGALAAAAVLGLAAPAPAEVFRSEPVRHRTIFVPRDKSLAFHLDGPASRIVVAQPDTASVRATGIDSFYVQGKELGATNLLVYGPGGRLAEVIDVRVGYDALALEEDLAAAFPSEAIRVHPLGAGLLLTGDVSNSGVVERVKALAERFAPQSITSNMTVRASQEVVLEVRILEATRSLSHDIGLQANVQNSSFQFAVGNGLVGVDPPHGVLNLFGGSGSTSIDVQLAALEAKGVVRTLARPNLVALSGEKASFLAGGEFPYPVPQDNNKITLEFRKYGVKLDFRPVVQETGFIRLEVEPEVSKLDPTNSLRVNGFTIPGRTTRNTKTVVELRSGASLAIGGLYQSDYQNDLRATPLIGDLPVIGALFRSARWRRGETELVIIVTPRLAEPADFSPARNPQSLGGKEATGVDLLLRGDALDKPMQGDPAPPVAEATAEGVRRWKSWRNAHQPGSRP
jgi:pilus assembly protein CpaC